MSLHCGFSSCQWYGPEDEVFDHVETFHKKFLLQPKGNLFFDLSLDDLQQEAFVLCSPNGLYWFRQKLQPQRDDGIDFGVFHIGESEQIEYTLKLGLKRDGHCEYWGSYSSQQDNLLQTNAEEEYNLKFDFEFLEMLNITMPSRRLRLYFGEYDDSDDKLCPGPQDIEWKEDDELLNRVAVEKFTCGICLEYIRRDARFCENKHFICLKCFDGLHERKQLKCPYCRGQYLVDCVDNDLEDLLRMIKWPDMPVPEVDKELLEYLQSKPNFSILKVRPGQVI